MTCLAAGSSGRKEIWRTTQKRWCGRESVFTAFLFGTLLHKVGAKVLLMTRSSIRYLLPSRYLSMKAIARSTRNNRQGKPLNMPGAPNKRQNRQKFSHAKDQAGVARLPRKRFYRQRAHANPFSDHTLE